MSNHVHLVFRSVNGQKPELLIGDLKRFTCQSPAPQSLLTWSPLPHEYFRVDHLSTARSPIYRIGKKFLFTDSVE